MTRSRITYFDIRGRAEPIRLILEHAGVAYEDRQISGDEWPELKARTPFGGLPILECAAGEIVQSHAIYRYLARAHDLQGASEAEHIRCDVTVEAFRDAKDHLGGAFWRPDFDARRQAFVDDEISPRLATLTRFYESGGSENGGLAGPSLTLADFMGFAYLDDLEEHFPGVLAQSPSLQRFRHGFAQRPKIATYLSSPRRPAALQYGPAGKIYPALTPR